MKENSSTLNSEVFYGSFIDNKNTAKRTTKPFSTITSLIKEKYSELFCRICKNFPLIDFCNHFDNIKYTCFCLYNRKILISDLIDNSLSKILLSSSINNIDDENLDNIGIICNQDKLKYSYFCQNCKKNLCQKCLEKHAKGHDIINFDLLKKYEDEKVNKIKEKILICEKENININSDNLEFSNDESSSNSKEIKIIKNNSLYTIRTQVQRNNDFIKLVKKIIDDYNNYPNYSNFFNIENIFYFLFKNNVENYGSSIENDEELRIYNEKEIQIDIEYINNINAKTKLFSKYFVKINDKNTYLIINNKKFELKQRHIFKTKEENVSVKLIIKNNINNIDLSKMFANCYNLKSLNGLSKLKRIKIINLNKMFYNCISLDSLPDISDWDISNVENASLMFYNCINLNPPPDLTKWKLNENLFLKSSLLFFNLFLNKDNQIILKNMIGEGSFGIVVKETIHEIDLRGNKKVIVVAAKYIKSKSLVKREKIKLLINLFKESGMMVNLFHKNIIKLISIHLTNTKIIMEYMKVGSLANVIYNNKNLSLYFKIYCLFEICNGLQFLHDRNIIHGDLKSLNILLDKEYEGESNYPILKISDFGLSGIKEDICPGKTPGFSAPELYEQNKNNRTIKSDIYSFGVVIYEIFKGEPPLKYSRIDKDEKKNF